MRKSLYSHHNEIFLELLRSNRESLKLRQADLAVRLGRGQATVSKVESGVRRLDIIELRTWLIALEVDFMSFMDELDQRLQVQPLSDARINPYRALEVLHQEPLISKRRRR
jgi:transcriptional regulator with XRE-family HTH domain